MSAHRAKVEQVATAIADATSKGAIAVLQNASGDDRRRFVFGVLGSLMAVADVFGVTFDEVREFLDKLELHKVSPEGRDAAASARDTAGWIARPERHALRRLAQPVDSPLRVDTASAISISTLHGAATEGEHMTTTINDVTVTGLVYSTADRTLELRATGAGYQVMDVTHSGAGRALGNVVTLAGARERAYATLCPQDPAVPGSDAAWRLAKSRRAAEISAANARWSAAMATCGEAAS